jgi:hypothetical protein
MSHSVQRATFKNKTVTGTLNLFLMNFHKIDFLINTSEVLIFISRYAQLIFTITKFH